MEVFEVFEIETNLEFNGKKLTFNVLANNAVNAAHVACNVPFNGKEINYSNIKSINPAFDGKVISSFYYDTVKDLNPDYKPENNENKQDNDDVEINLDEDE